MLWCDLGHAQFAEEIAGKVRGPHWDPSSSPWHGWSAIPVPRAKITWGSALSCAASGLGEALLCVDDDGGGETSSVREREETEREDGEGSERKIKDHRGFIGDVVVIIIIIP